MWRQVSVISKAHQVPRFTTFQHASVLSPRRHSSGITLLEFSICFLIAFLALGMVVMCLQGTLVQTKEVALSAELRNMRRALKVYYVFNQDYPSDIRTLFGRDSKLFGESQIAFNPDALRSLSQDQHGYPIDPFGARYTYDPVAGKLWSVTLGYEKW